MSDELNAEVELGELLRRAMRHWVTGVAVATSRLEEVTHGMTVNSFGSISLYPPMVTVTMNNDAFTHNLVDKSGIFAITLLNREQQGLAELFAGRFPDRGDRMLGLDTFVLATGAPLIRGGMAFIDCRVAHKYEMLTSTLFIGEVVAAQSEPEGLPPLIYFDRRFAGLD